MVAAKALLILVSFFSVAADAELLCFGATWCQPCREMQPALDRLEREGYALRKFDVDARPELARRYQVSAVPSFVLVDGSGAVVDRIDQATSFETLAKMLAHYHIEPIPRTVRGQSMPEPIESKLQPVEAKPPLQAAGGENLELQSTNSSASSLDDPCQMSAMAATVRLSVEDETGHSFGTGTVVDVHGEEALVLTCGHIFRESQGKGQILIDRFDTAAAEPTTGSVISYDINLDVALVSMKLTRPIQIARLAPLEYKAQKVETIFSIGCSHGEAPTVMNGEINHIDKYLGPPNITASGRPVDGRSGGGLFNRAGQLIGVCSAADPEFNEGIYAALPRVYHELDRNGLSFVYRREKPKTETKELDVVANASQHVAAQLSPASSAAIAPVSHQAPLPSGEVKNSGNELVCVLRGEGQDGRAFVIKNPSKILLEYLAREARNGG